ncbi:MAG: BadF/BadG/BcrA/BcrD ATPase family protein [Nannocystaceae bacterium]
MKINYAVGVDLGSTTTKAVILDEGKRPIGRGITNSRSNYDIACKVAMGEAMIDARFTLLSASLRDAGMQPERLRQVIGRLGRAFRKQQYLAQLEVLQQELCRAAGGEGADGGHQSTIFAVVDQMRDEATALYRPGATRKSDFFRDLAASSYHETLETKIRANRQIFDALVGYFDKAILQVENSFSAVGQFSVYAAAALDDAQLSEDRVRRAVAASGAAELQKIASVGTGYGRARLPFEEASIRSEILCHGLGAHALFPKTRTVLDIGGQDTKGIQVDEKGIVTSFQMNDRCAAGCGRYLGYIADEMNIGLHQLGPMARKATRRVKINSTCTVFAGAELRERISLGEKREDILGGLHRAIVLRAMSILARSGGVRDEFTFTGGVANNSAAVHSLRQLIRENYGERTVNISPESIYMGALGAALFALRSVRDPAPVVVSTETSGEVRA